MFFEALLRGRAEPPFKPELDGNNNADFRHYDTLDESELPPVTPYISTAERERQRTEEEAKKEALAQEQEAQDAELEKQKRQSQLQKQKSGRKASRLGGTGKMPPRKKSISAFWDRRASESQQPSSNSDRAAAVNAAVDKYRKQSGRKPSGRSRKGSRADTLQKLRSESRLQL
jgi:hypothetical protein